jgi:AraC-like DNA-binding protein
LEFGKLLKRMQTKLNHHPPRLSSDAEFDSLNRAFRFYRTCLSDPYPLHWHDFFEMSLIIKGTGNHYLNGSEQTIGPGSIFFLTPVDLHTIDPLGESLWLYNLIFSDNLISEKLRDFMLTNMGDQSLTATLTGEQFKEIRTEYEWIENEIQAYLPGQDILVHSAIERMLILIYRQAISTKNNGTAIQNLHPGLRKALYYMQHHFREPLLLNEVASRANLAPRYFSELFHTQTGQTYQAYLQELRVRFARKLLVSTQLPITEVYLRSGFGSFSQFNRVFRQQYNHAPREYRQSLQELTKAK